MASLALNGAAPIRRQPLPLHRPWFGTAEMDAVAECLRSGEAGGDGPRGKQLERRLEELLGARRVLVVTSCTGALEMALLLSHVRAGDEVILPSFNFPSAANAIVRLGARPVFVDVERRTGNIDPERIRAALTDRTRAIVPVHYAGMACAIDTIEAIAARHGLVVVEDAAHALNASYRGRPLGAWGAMGCLSFHQTKEVVCGEGGALVLRDDETFARAAEIVREKGTDRSAFLRGERDRYRWVGLGGSYALSDLLAALGLAQLEKLEESTGRKREHAEFFLDALAPHAELIELPLVPDGCRPNWHLFAVRVDPKRRDWILRALRAEGIGAASHYEPLHSAPFALEHPGVARVDLPETEYVASAVVRLPLHAGMTVRDRQDVVDALDRVLSAVAAHA